MPHPSPLDIARENAAAYDVIADRWDVTRRRGWGEFAFVGEAIHALAAPFTPALSPEEKGHAEERERLAILDAGCGNGRLVDYLDTQLDSYDYLGVDHSAGLLDKARGHHPTRAFRQADLTTFTTDQQYDLVVSIAVLHHLPPAGQLAALRRLHAALRPDGQLVVTYWNLWQPRHFPAVLRSFLRLTPRHCRIPFESRVERYVYAATAGGIRQLLAQAGFHEIAVCYTDRGRQTTMWQGRNIVATATR